MGLRSLGGPGGAPSESQWGQGSLEEEGGGEEVAPTWMAGGRVGRRPVTRRWGFASSCSRGEAHLPGRGEGTGGSQAQGQHLPLLLDQATQGVTQRAPLPRAACAPDTPFRGLWKGPGTGRGSASSAASPSTPRVWLWPLPTGPPVQEPPWGWGGALGVVRPRQGPELPCPDRAVPPFPARGLRHLLRVLQQPPGRLRRAGGPDEAGPLPTLL